MLLSISPQHLEPGWRIGNHVVVKVEEIKSPEEEIKSPDNRVEGWRIWKRPMNGPNAELSISLHYSNVFTILTPRQFARYLLEESIL